MERVLGFLSRHFFRQVIFDDFFSVNWVRKNSIFLNIKRYYENKKRVQ